MKRSFFLLTLGLSTGLISHGTDIPLPPSATGTAVEAHDESAPPVEKEAQETIESFRELARRAVSNGENGLAEIYFSKALGLSLPAEAKRDLLTEFGHFLEEKAGKPTKAAAVYEQVLALFANSPETPDISLRLGRIQRGLGANKAALNKFYNVLHATLRVKNGNEYQALVQRAQFEIAETHFALGEYAAAGKFYSRLKLLDLAADIRGEVHFKSAYLLFLGKDFPGALASAQEYLKTFSGSASAPEAQFLVIRSLKELGREDEAIGETVKLLRAGREHGAEHPHVWAYWQQKIGSELANELYGKGDSLNALTIYQRLAELSDRPDWRWPAVYQIALCFERLRHFDRALEAYAFLAKGGETAKQASSKTAEAAPAPVGVNLQTIQEMAQWRLNQLKWLAETDKELTVLLSRKTPPPLEGAGFMVKPDLRQDPAKLPLQAGR